MDESVGSPRDTHYSLAPATMTMSMRWLLRSSGSSPRQWRGSLSWSSPLRPLCSQRCICECLSSGACRRRRCRICSQILRRKQRRIEVFQELSCNWNCCCIHPWGWSHSFTTTKYTSLVFASVIAVFGTLKMCTFLVLIPTLLQACNILLCPI